MSYDYEKQDMIEKIYEEVADKTLSFGCQVAYRQYMIPSGEPYHCEGIFIHTWKIYYGSDILGNPIVDWIVGHPIHFGTMIRYLKQEYPENSKVEIDKLFEIWEDFDLPLEKQSKKVVEYVFNLLPKEKEKQN